MHTVFLTAAHYTVAGYWQLLHLYQDGGRRYDTLNYSTIAVGQVL